MELPERERALMFHAFNAERAPLSHMTPIFYAYLFVAAVLIAAATVMSVKRAESKKPLTEAPDALRKRNARQVPLAGGAVVATLLITVGVLATFTAFLLGPFFKERAFPFILLFITYVFALLGYWDDLRPLSARVKIAVQTVAACLAAYVWFHPFDAPIELLYASPKYGAVTASLGAALGACFIVFWLLSCANSFNLLDGADGFAGTFAILVFATLAGVLKMWNEPSLFLETSAWLTVAVLAGFLVRNKPPAKVYLGDAGSLAIGVYLGAFALCLFSSRQYVRPVPVLCLMTLPAIDSAFAVVRRLALGRSVLSPDLEHLQHLLERKFGHGWLPIAVLAALQIPLSAATLAGYWFDCDDVPLAAAVIYWFALPISGLFGRNELRLAATRLRAAFNARFRGGSGVFLDAFRQPENETLWRNLLERAQERGCVAVRVSANYPAADVDWFGSWRAPREPGADPVAFTEPLQMNGVAFGTIYLAFNPNATAPNEAFEAVDALRAFAQTCVPQDAAPDGGEEDERESQHE